MSISIGYALCGSFCTFSQSLQALRMLVKQYNVLPIMSETAYATDTRFGKASDFIWEIESTTGHHIIHTIPGAEPPRPQTYD